MENDAGGVVCELDAERIFTGDRSDHCLEKTFGEVGRRDWSIAFNSSILTSRGLEGSWVYCLRQREPQPQVVHSPEMVDVL